MKPTIKYPWHKPSTGPTPPVLWVCTACGEAFWAEEVQDRRYDRRYSCSNGECPKYGVRKAIRRATTEETIEAEKHVTVGGERILVDERPRSRKRQFHMTAYRSVRKKKAADKAARKAARKSV